MADPLRRLGGFLIELKRRKVYRVAAVYVVVAIAALELVDILVPSTRLPEWATGLLVALAILGFPLVVVLAWAYELTPEGIRKAASPGGGETGTRGGVEVGSHGVAVTAAPDDAGEEEEPARGRAGEGEAPAGPRAGEPAVEERGRAVGRQVREARLRARGIAVLPFETLGSDRDTAFTDAVHGDLLTRLSGLSDLTVISRPSVLRYRRSAKPLPVIASELGVAWVLGGEVLEAGGRVQVSARLMNASEDRQVWAESYRRRMTAEELFEIQAEITHRITEALEARLSAEEEREVEERPTGDLEAYRLCAQGRRWLDQRTDEGMRRAAEHFRRALARDRGYALAWVGLADALILLFEYGHAEGEAVLEEAEEAARTALELEPRMAEAHASLGLLHEARRQGPAAVRTLERAVELRPGYAEAHNWLSWVHLLLGNGAQALESAEVAVELNPLSAEAVSNLVWGLLARGDAAGALRESRRIREVEPALSWGPFVVGMALYHVGRFEEAAAVLREVSVPWAAAEPALTRALALAASGAESEARALLARFREAGDGFAAGLVHAALGDEDRALEAFGRVERWEYWPVLAVHHFYPDILGPLRADPRFADVVRAARQAWSLEPAAGT